MLKNIIMNFLNKVGSKVSNLRDDLTNYIENQFKTNESIHNEIKEIYPFLKRIGIPIKKEHIDSFLAHLKESIISSLLIYAEKKNIENLDENKKEVEEVILKAIESAKITYGYLTELINNDS